MPMTYPQRASRSQSRMIGLAGVAALHVAIVYALVSGLGQCVVDIVRQPLEARFVVEAKPLPPPPPEPPKPQPKTAPPPKAYVPPPAVKAAVPVPAAITAITQTPPPEPVTRTGTAEPTPAPPEPVRVAAALDPSATCRPPQYPPQSRRNGESGAVVLRFLIEADGSVIESQVESSSGYTRLDEAAVNGLSLCHFKPGTSDGRAERSWARMRYVWKLN